MKRISGIYKIENIKSKKVYIGQSVNIYKRWNKHTSLLNKNLHPNIYLQNAWNKYGKQNFKFEIIEICETREQLNERETYWKNFFDPNTYNLGKTGNAHNLSQEIKDKISITNKGNKYRLGKKLSNESKEKISKSKIGKPSKKAKEIICIETQTIYKSSCEAAKILGFAQSSINECCNGKLKTVNGYHFCFTSNLDMQNCTSKFIGQQSYSDNTAKENRSKSMKQSWASGKIKSHSQRKIICIETQEIFDSLTAAADKYKVKVSTICCCLTGKSKSAGKLNGQKLHWRYI